MTPTELRFIEFWEKRRKRWNWFKMFRTVALRFVLPIVFVVDLIIYFLIGGLPYAYISFAHLFRVISQFLGFSILLGLAYGIFDWNFNESRYKRLIRKRDLNS